MKRAVRFSICLVAGIMLAVVATEALLRLMPVARGLFRTLEADRWPLFGYTSHATYTYSMTWDFQTIQEGTTNNYGHLAPFDFVKNSRPILVLGDSFIEAQMLRYSDTLQGQLGQLTGPAVPVYGMGFSGNSIAEYLAVATLAKDEFQPRAAVTLLHDGDIVEAIGARALHHYFEFNNGQLQQGYQPAKVNRTLRRIRERVGDSALYRYVLEHLKFSLKRLLSGSASATPLDSTRIAQARQQQRQVVERFLVQFAEQSAIPAPCIVFLIDGNRNGLYDTRYKPQPEDPPEILDYFISRGRELGYQVVELGPLFLTHYQKHGQKFDFLPMDSHWNWLGHKLAAEATLATLKQTPACMNVN